MTHFHDPSRPRMGGRPCWLGGNQSALPNLTIEPMPDGKFLLGLMVEVEPGAYALRTVVCAEENLQIHISAYAQDPELWAKYQLGHLAMPTHISRPRPRKAPEGFEPLQPKQTLTLEDLGL